jgi:hypothetical protein
LRDIKERARAFSARFGGRKLHEIIPDDIERYLSSFSAITIDLPNQELLTNILAVLARPGQKAIFMDYAGPIPTSGYFDIPILDFTFAPFEQSAQLSRAKLEKTFAEELRKRAKEARQKLAASADAH